MKHTILSFISCVLIWTNSYSAWGPDPKVSILTSVYRGDQFIEQFMEEIVKQTMFDQCELIMIDADSPGHEQEIIFQYIKRYPNIIYVKLPFDPGIYGVWQLGVKMARGEYLVNANLDDRYAYDCYEIQARELDTNPQVDLVYSGIWITEIPNETFYQTRTIEQLAAESFSYKKMKHCLPLDHPMWRKSMHEKYGTFDDQFVSAGDWEMWLRAVINGAKFKAIKKNLGLHYRNPQGLSTGVDTMSGQEVALIKQMYCTVYKFD